MKTYRGIRNKQGDVTVTVEDPRAGGKLKPLAMRLDLRKHSPTGFNWGYAGSGPAQLALAICADALGDDERALRVYQRVKGELLVNAPDQMKLYLSHEQVMEAIERVEQERETPEENAKRQQLAWLPPARSKVMVMKVDPDGTPRAWGVALTLEAAQAEAARQLVIYRKRKAEVGDPLATADFTERVETLKGEA